MAEILVGDVVARLKADTAQFSQALNTVIQRLAQLNQATTQARAQQSQSIQGTQHQAQAYTQLAQAAQTAQQAVNQLRQQTQQIQHVQQQATTSAHAMGSAFQTAFAVAGGIGIATSLGAVVAAIRNTLTESVRLAARMQDLTISFRAIEGSASGASRTLTSLFATAQRLGVEFATLVEGFRRLTQAAQGTGLQGEQIRAVFDNVIAGARVMGVSGEELKRTIVTLGQILSKGTLQAEEYRGQLAEAVPGALRLLASGLGMTTKQFEEMVELGIIPAELAVAAFGKGMGDLAQAQEPVQRLSEIFNRLKNETTAWMTAIGEGVGSILTPFLETLTKISIELRAIFRIPVPGTQAAPAGDPNSFLYKTFPFLTRPTGQAPPSGGSVPFASSQFDALIRREAERIQFDPALLSQLVRQESGFNPRAVSPAGAAGLGQLMPATGREFGLLTREDFADPEKNLTAAANVLHQYRTIIQDKFGTLADETKILLAAYNAGIGNVIKAITETQAAGQQATFGQVLSRLPKPSETGPYVAKITGTQAPTGAPAIPVAAIDPFANVSKSIEDTLASLARIQTSMESLQQSGLNFGGILEGGLNKQAQQAVEKFTRLATFFAAFPEQLAKLTPVQREQLELAARQVVALEARMETEKSTAAEARQRVQVLRQFEEQLAREQEQDNKQYQEAIDKVTMSLAAQEEQALKTLAAINAQFFQRREERALDVVADIQTRFPFNEVIQAQAAQAQASLETRDAYNLEVEALRERFTALKLNTDALREHEEATTKFTEDVATRLEVLQAPREEREGVRLRRRAEREGIDLTPELEQQLRLIDEQTRWNLLMGEAERLGDQAAQTITHGLLSIIDGTVAVGQGFKNMAKSILDSIAEITLNEGFRALIRLGLGVAFGALAPGAGAGAGAGLGTSLTVGTGFETMFQHGGVVNRPTRALLGEGPPHTLPEYVLNRQQMQSLMASGPSAGGQAVNVTTILVDSRAKADQVAAQERSLGRQVIIQEVVNELSQGAGSKIGQVMRSTLR